MTEKERIEKVMQHEGMNSALFAAEIGIQSSTLSHILNGRNNPSLSVLQSILSRFPDISPEWLIMGQGSMDRNGKSIQGPTLFDPIPQPITTPVFDIPTEKSEPVLTTSDAVRQSSTTNLASAFQMPLLDTAGTNYVAAPQDDTLPRSVVKVIVYYSDNTFQEFK